MKKSDLKKIIREILSELVDPHTTFICTDTNKTQLFIRQIYIKYNTPNEAMINGTKSLLPNIALIYITPSKVHDNDITVNTKVTDEFLKAIGVDSNGLKTNITKLCNVTPEKRMSLAQKLAII